MAKKEFETGAMVSAYPNPATDNITLSAKQMVSIAIYDFTGKTVYSQDGLKTDTMMVSTANFESGIYMARITTLDGRSQQLKIIKN